MSREPLHLAVIQRGVTSLDDYLRLARALIVDQQQGLVTPERASVLLQHALPEDVEIPASVVEAMCGELLDGVERGETAPDATSARLFVSLLRRLAPQSGMITRARALGVPIDDA